MTTKKPEETDSNSHNVYFLDEFRSRDPAELTPTFTLGSKKFHDLATRWQENRQRIIEASQSAKLCSAVPIILNQVSYGRNAWNSTWIARYLQDTLLASREEVHSLIQRRLVQGTSYRLTVMPGWHLQFENTNFLIAEINTSKPFERLLDPAFASIGIQKQDALTLLDPSSNCWRGLKPSHDSVIVQETKRPASEFQTWGDRTSHPDQVRTPGVYKRVIDGGNWWMTAANGDGPVDYDVSGFEAALRQLEVSGS